MFSLKNIPKHCSYDVTSVLCPIIAAAFIALEMWRQEDYSRHETGLADFGGLWILVLSLWLMPVSSLIGLLSGIRGFVLQPRINGMGLWGMMVNAILLALLAFIWARVWILTRYY